MISEKRDPKVWETSKRRACSDAGLCDHSARKMQWASRYYKSHGGRYVGRKASRRNSLSRWTRQKWRTHNGSPSNGVRRYLPDAAWARLSPDQVRRTNASKRRGTKAGNQYVRQPSDVAEVAAVVRRQSDDVSPRHLGKRSQHDGLHTEYPWMSYAAAHAHEEDAARHGVSEVARGPGGFMRVYEVHGMRMKNMLVMDTPSSTLTWARKRHNFVKRHMVQYVGRPTLRRWLALVMWAYRPPGPVPSLSPY